MLAPQQLAGAAFVIGLFLALLAVSTGRLAPHAARTVSLLGDAQAPCPSQRTISLGVGASAPCPSQRRVFVDLGANWANTLRLWQDFPSNRTRAGAGAWEVYAFEASALIQPYLDDFVRALNDGSPEPEAPVPRTGGSFHLARYAPSYGCPDTPHDAMRECMWRKLDDALNKLAPRPELNTSSVLAKRLGEARACNAGAQARYTLVPAAVGVENGHWLRPAGAEHRKQLIRGGLHVNTSTHEAAAAVHWDLGTRIIDFPAWFDANFGAGADDDIIYLKMDIEGAEQGLISTLHALGTLPRVDRLFWECHPDVPGVNCTQLRGWLAEAGVEVTDEGTAYHGWDRSSAPPQ